MRPRGATKESALHALRTVRTDLERLLEVERKVLEDARSRGASLREISHASGISKSALHRRFGGRR